MSPFSVLRRRREGSRVLRRLGGYAFALAAFGVALEARFLLAPILPPAGFPFLTFFPAVLLTAFVAGLGPSLLASALGVAAAAYFFVPPVNSIALAGAPEVVAVGFFAAILVVDCVVIHVMTTAQRALRAEQTRADEAAAAQGRLVAELSRVLEATSDGVLALGSDWQVSFMNGHARRLIAGGRDLIGQVLWDAYPEAIGSAFWHAFRRCVAERVPTEAADYYSPLGRAFAARAFPAEGGGITVFFRDVTEERAAAARLAAKAEAERRAREALAESESRLRLALQAGRMGVWSWDLAADRLEWDARHFELFGMDPAACQPSGEAALARVHPENLPGLKQTIEAAIAAGDGTFEHEFRLLLPCGATRWIGGYGHAMPGLDGRADRKAGLNFDITARRGAEAALRESEARLRLAEHAARVGSFDWDVEANATTFSEGYAALHGLPEGSRVEVFQDWLSRVHPEDRQQALAATADLSPDAPLALGYRIIRPRDGEVRHIQERRDIFRNAGGRAVRVVGLQQDATEQRRAEAALRDSEARLRLVLDAAELGTWAWEVGAGTIDLEWDLRCKAMFSLPPDAEVDYASWAALLVDEDRVATEAAVARALDPAVADDDLVAAYRVHRADGNMRWLSISGRAFFEADPLVPSRRRVVRILGTIEDVTEAHEATAALARANAEAREAAERVQLALAAGAIVGTRDWELPADRFTVDERFAFFFGIDPMLGRIGLSLEQVIATVHPDDLAGLRTAIAEAIGQGGPYAHQYRVRGRDGVHRWIEANGRVDHAADGTPTRFPGVLLDIHARRQADAARGERAPLPRRVRGGGRRHGARVLRGRVCFSTEVGPHLNYGAKN